LEDVAVGQLAQLPQAVEHGFFVAEEEVAREVVLHF
jgi:hypothetical protein